MTESSHDDVIAVLIRDHREVQALFDELEQTPDSADPKRRKNLVDRVTVDLVRHATAEEQFLYPTVRSTVDGGAELADREFREHEQVERSLKELEGMQPGEAPFEPTLLNLIALVNAHFADEEQTLFPRLRSVCTDDVLVEIGKLVTAGKKVAPTRPRSGARGHRA